MFLKATLERNPRLIETAIAFHRSGVIPPNCFVVDSDAVEGNASLLHAAALKHGLALYFTTKQIGFNPLLARRIVDAGIPKAIAVDAREASVLSMNHIPIGHVGHLAQIPTQMIPAILNLEPEVVTVYSVAKAEEISHVAARQGRHVRLLLRVVAEGDYFYPGQEGGICFDRLPAEATAIQKLPNVRIVGVTSFPCLSFDEAGRELVPTPNLKTMLAAAHVLRDDLSIRIEQINAPSNTCVASMDLLARLGATHAEPGHALTGTTYSQAESGQGELPAMVYVSEVSHLYDHRAFVFGGGTYRRAKINHALVGSRADRLVHTEVLPLDTTAIDYYVALPLPKEKSINVGDTVVIASRAQVFVSRSFVAVVKGIQAGKPTFEGLFDASGRAVERMF